MSGNLRGKRTKRTNEIIAGIVAAGGAYQFTANHHLLVYGPLGTATIPSKIDSSRTLKNTLADLRRYAGLDLGPRKQPRRRTTPESGAAA